MRDGRKTNLHVKTESNTAEMRIDPTFGGVFDRERMREYAEEAGRAAREMGRNLPDVMDGMRNGMPNRPRLGVSVQDVTPELAEYFGVKSGVLVASVTADSPAARAGLKAGDVITAVDGTSVSSPAELVSALPSGDAAREITVTFVRDKQQRSAKATIQPPSRDGGTAPRRGQRV